MDRKTETVHYHIRWAQIPLLDWESFNTRVQAEAGAKMLARISETYISRNMATDASDVGMPRKRKPRH